LGLNKIYIDLDTTKQQEAKPGKKGEAIEMKERKPIAAMDAIRKNKKVVLLGDPGSGKSTFLSYIAHGLAMQGLGNRSWRKDWPSEFTNSISVHVILRDFARLLSEKSKDICLDDLWQYILSGLKRNHLDGVENRLKQALENGDVFLLLDGLDEVSSSDQLSFVVKAIQKFIERYEKCQCLITCRTLSYKQISCEINRFQEFTLAPFRPDQIHQFIRLWYEELELIGALKKGEDVDFLIKRLKTAVNKPDMKRLSPNPLLLTVMAVIHTHKGRLPDARALLYEEIIDLLLFRWDQSRSIGQGGESTMKTLLHTADRMDLDLKKVLWELAFKAHKQGATSDKPDVLADIGELDLEKALAKLNHEDRNWAQQVIEAMKLRAGLLKERVPGVFTLPHRTFQEYMAGAFLTTRKEFVKEIVRLSDNLSIWREVFLLAVGRLVYVNGETDRPVALFAELCPESCSDNEEGLKQSWFVGDLMFEMGLPRVRDTKLGRRQLMMVKQHLAALIEEDRLKPIDRAAAACTLARLGDDRRGVGIINGNRLPDIVWCHVPEGKFWMGSDKKDKQADSDESPLDELDLPAFYMSRYPVTNDQFHSFVKDHGYEKSEYWPEAIEAKVWKDSLVEDYFDNKTRFKLYDFGEPFNLPNHPVVGITWYEALAFCRWLEEIILNGKEKKNIRIWANEESVDQSLDPGRWTVTLPSEAQWEKGARGQDKRIYPWGDKADPNRANYSDTEIGSTSAVGCFPTGASPYGLLDMSGNVWEWTRSLGFVYPYNKNLKEWEDLKAGKEKGRVLRGGSFYGSAGFVRCACRFRDDPVNWGNNLGFRIVLSPL